MYNVVSRRVLRYDSSVLLRFARLGRETTLPRLQLEMPLLCLGTLATTVECQLVDSLDPYPTA